MIPQQIAYNEHGDSKPRASGDDPFQSGYRDKKFT